MKYGGKKKSKFEISQGFSFPKQTFLFIIILAAEKKKKKNPKKL